ncbi:hypothetical protein [Mycoplasmopsis synoviae]|uniref:DNA polymerase III subunit delta n=1 Tax=Mycoplasmopsis synoviae TaxID=2109 RepID=A0A3B0P5H7_MYCSY|nr:hypothetical protein [Mycoplasmopsis synoviae]AKB10834.1 DNA polymerase III subunit delta' [Mycoplasmopsis synoviae ATCC 25204]SYV92378.1 DNA polymerase III subunit delta' [Mycoplasmopsis synoviae]
MIDLKILSSLKEKAMQNTLHHFFLLNGNHQEVSKEDILEFLNSINNNQSLNSLEDLPENIIYFDNSDEILKKEDFLSAIEKFSFKNSDEKSFLIINNLEKTSNVVLNAILKTIEEPSDNIYFIFTSKYLFKLLPTIISRAFVINVSKVSQDQILSHLSSDKKFDEFEFFISYLAKSFYQADEFNSKSYKDFTQKFIEVLDFALYENIYKLASFLNEHIEKNSIKSEFVIEFLILFAKIEIFQNKKTEENKYFKSLFGLFENYKDAEISFYLVITYIDTYLNNNLRNSNYYLNKQNLILNILSLYE